MKVAIIIPVFNRKTKTLECLGQLRSADNPGLDITIVIVDDGSTDGTAEAVMRDFPDTMVLKGDGNLWWTGAINMGIEYALDNGFEAVLLLNDDLVLVPDFIVELYTVVQHNNNALVSSLKLIEHKNGSPEILTAGFNIKGKLKKIKNNLQGVTYDKQAIEDVLECDILTGASLFVPLAVVRDIGLLDFLRFPHNWGDLEYTWRASLKGYKCLVATRSHIYTEYNPNYHRTYFTSSSRIDYLKNLFDNKKFGYGFRFLFNRSFMHRTPMTGLTLYIRGLISLISFIALKLLLPKSVLAIYFNNL